MTIQLMSGGAIIIGCAYLGILLAASFKKRVRQLAEFRNVLAQLEFDIDFRCIPLSESLKNMGKNCQGAVRDVLLYISERLSEDRCVNMQKLWSRAINRFKYELFLTEEDIEIILIFSKNLGSGDCSQEKNNLKMASARLKMAEDEALEIAKRNVKMCRGLGILAGIFIVIVLV